MPTKDRYWKDSEKYNSEKERKRKREWAAKERVTNPEKARQRRRDWRAKNPDKERTQNRTHKRRINDITKTVPSIYFVRMGETPYIKIGKTDNPPKRLKELQTGNPYPLRIELLIPSTKERIYMLEKALHDLLKGANVLNEWFYIPDDMFETTKNALKDIA